MWLVSRKRCGLRSRRKVLWAGNRVASNRVLEEVSWRHGSGCAALVRVHHPLLAGLEPVSSGVRDATESIRGGFRLR